MTTFIADNSTGKTNAILITIVQYNYIMISKCIKYKVASMCFNASMLLMVLVLLTFLNCYISTFCLIHYALLLTPAG